MIAGNQSLLFDDLGPRQVQADFSGGTLSSDAGALLLRQVDRNLGLTRALAQCFGDGRNQFWVEHSVEELVRQRIYATALGYEDINDQERLGLDPLVAAACEKTDPLGQERLLPQHRGIALASPATLNRLSCRIIKTAVATSCPTTRPRLKLACSKWECGVCPSTPGKWSWIWTRWAIGCTACKRDGTSTPTMMITVICRCMRSWGISHCGRNCAPPITTRRREWCQRWRRWWQPFANAAARRGSLCGVTAVLAGRRSWLGARVKGRAITVWVWPRTPF